MAPGNPAPPDAFRGSWRDALGQATYRRILNDPNPASRRRPISFRRAPALGIAAVASLAVVAAVAVPHLTGDSGVSGTAMPSALNYRLTGVERPLASTRLPSASGVLLRLARIAAQQPASAQPPGADIGYVLTREWNLTVAVAGGSSASSLVPHIDQTWTSPAGSYREVEHSGRPQLIGAGSQQTEQAVASTPTLRVISSSTAAGFGPLAQRLPTDSVALRDALIRSAAAHTFPATPVPFYLLGAVAGVGHEMVSPRLMGAFWRVLAAEPDIYYLGAVRDRAGRLGDAVAADFGGRGDERLVLIISPSTGALLGEEDVFMTNPGKLTITSFPVVIGYITYLREGWTQTMTTPAP
ncbi:MAG: CU044_5270 family protein [Streptosporangiaceae bacterium]